ncbi:MAG: outer membrane beta-barrel protein [Rhodospirillales bacterium]|nr:outer membrane beta-barrel protein [Rhodospirillales bacterium]
MLKSDLGIKRWPFLLLAGAILLGAGAGPSMADETDTTPNLSRNLTRFERQSNLISGSIKNEINGWDVGLKYLYGRTSRRGDDFLSMRSFTPTLGHSVTDSWYVSLRYNYQNKDFIGADNDRRDGGLNSGMIDNFLFFRDGKAYFSLGYQAEGENTDWDELDYFGHIFHARLKLPITVDQLKSWDPAINVGLKYADKDYSGVTPSIGAERKDERTTFNLGLNANLSRHVFAKFDYEYTDTQSNLKSSNFNENIVTFSVGVRY